MAPATSLLDRLNIHAIDGVDVRREVLGDHRASSQAGRVVQGARPRSATARSGGWRRRLNMEWLARVAKSDCLGRTGTFDCTAMDWFLEKARRLGVEHQPPRPLLLGRHLIDLGVAPGPRWAMLLKQIYERQLDGEITTIEEGIEAAREALERRK